MKLKPIIILFPILFSQSHGVRLHKLFGFLGGYRTDDNLQGFLHLGRDYSVFLRLPNAHDRFLVYELYETKGMGTSEKTKPRILAISQIPVEYIKEALKTFRDELYRAKYVDENMVPGVLVRTVQQWQIDKRLENNPDGIVLNDKPMFMRTRVVNE